MITTIVLTALASAFAYFFYLGRRIDAINSRLRIGPTVSDLVPYLQKMPYKRMPQMRRAA